MKLPLLGSCVITPYNILFVEESKVGCQQTVQECCSEDTKVVKTCHPPSVCPKGCTCDGTTVRCSGLGLTEFPANIPTDTTEL